MTYPTTGSGYTHDSEIVLLGDERMPVQDVLQHPYRWICSLEVEFSQPVLYPLATLEQSGKRWANTRPSWKGCGTGLMISPTHILTAAHVISGLKIETKDSKKEKHFKLIKAMRVKVIPGRTEGTMTKMLGHYQSKRIYVSSGFQYGMQKPVDKLTRTQVKKCLAADYGIIELESNSGLPSPSLRPSLKLGWWRQLAKHRIIPVHARMRRSIKNRQMQIAGYPGEKGKVSCGSLWKSSGKIRTASPMIRNESQDLLLYDADTSAGMSGSPVWIKHSGTFYLIGVHSSFIQYPNPKGNRSTYNVAALVTTKMLKELHRWNVDYLEINIK